MRVLAGKRRRFLEQHQSIAFHVRQRLEQHAVDDAEHRGVGADAQAQHQDGDQREPRLTPERSRRIAHRACGPVEPQQPALLAALLAHALDAAEPRPGAAARLVGRHALVHQVPGLEVEMELQLGVELLVELLARCRHARTCRRIRCSTVRPLLSESAGPPRPFVPTARSRRAAGAGRPSSADRTSPGGCARRCAPTRRRSSRRPSSRCSAG